MASVCSRQYAKHFYTSAKCCLNQVNLRMPSPRGGRRKSQTHGSSAAREGPLRERV